MPVRPKLLCQFAALPLMSMPFAAMAANLMYLTGYGAESTMMGGADVAVSRDTFAVNNNPAGLSQIESKAMDINWSVFDAEGGTHTDAYGNSRRHIKNQFGTYGNLGYASHIPDSPFTWGVGFVVQGGLGWVYKNMTTSPALGSQRDEATSLFSVLKLAPAISWQVNDQLSLGAGLGLNYMAGQQTLFPNTSVDDSFFGVNFKDASGTGITAKLGLQYRPFDNVVIGMTYGSKTKIDLKGGTLRANYSAWTGVNQVVRYDDAQLKGFGLPQEIAIGLAFRPTKSLLVSVQDKWYDWSDVLKRTTLIAKNPRGPTPAGFEQLTLSSQVGALDQHIYSLGFAYEYSDDLTLLGGINYGKRAIPEQNLSPTFQAIQQMHYMLGLRRQVNREWAADVGLERLTQQMVTYNNPALPFGPSVATHSGTVLHLQASRRWD